MMDRLGHVAFVGILAVSLVTVAGTIQASAQTRPALVVVQNTSAQPVPTTDVGNPAYSPLRLKSTGTVPAGFVGSFGMTIGSAIPADRRFVIEFVSFNCGSPGGVEPAQVTLSVAESTGAGSFSFHNYPIILSRSAPNYSGSVTLVAAQSLRWYHDGGQALQFGVSLTGVAPAGGVPCNVEVSGYTVPML